MKRDVGFRSLFCNGRGMTHDAHDAHDAISFQVPHAPSTYQYCINSPQTLGKEVRHVRHECVVPNAHQLMNNERSER